MFHNSIKIVLISSLLIPVSTLAYVYTFINKTDSDIEVQWQEVGVAEPIETIIVPKQVREGRTNTMTPGVASRNIKDGLRFGLCMSMSSKTLSARKLPNGNALYPLVIHRNSKAYTELIKTNKVTSVDFGQICKNFTGTADAANKCNPKGMLCFDLEFEIHETDDNHLVFAFK